MAISVELNTPLAQALNEVIQPKLVEVGWSTGGGDDSALAEYVILMLVNGKTQEQIASELANDLLGLGPDDMEAVDFSRWLFEQVELLNKRLNGELAEPEPEKAAQAIPSFTEGSDDLQACHLCRFVASHNPRFETAQGLQNQGRSLFERAEHHKDRNPHFQRHHQNGRQHNQGTNMDVDGGPKESTDTQMEEAPQSESQDRGTEGVCRYNLRCTNKDCPYAHQSPAAPEGTTVDVSDVCPFGAACKNRKCVARHPSPAQKAMHQSEELCKYFPHCQNPHCQFKHPSMPLCRNGADCSVPGCKFTHQQIPCRYKPCLNPTCPFKHSEGQKGVFSDKVWTAERKDAPHVSERKFVSDEAGEEELIKPPPSSSEAEIVT
ncbi:hypothetical protein CIHG_01326 [Coccidioides immitis H538.4]|uniref:Nab2-like CCCH zinc finger domain-containing protein n=1 Tax=Coccidioides immitis H538.4 TaxID=396776 RepID=A0A0J8U8Y5_COCIT|nr:hypothetical protein CIHG_01326 [Coccidioides immitis H538.4]